MRDRANGMILDDTDRLGLSCHVCLSWRAGRTGLGFDVDGTRDEYTTTCLNRPLLYARWKVPIKLATYHAQRTMEYGKLIPRRPGAFFGGKTVQLIWIKAFSSPRQNRFSKWHSYQGIDSARQFFLLSAANATGLPLIMHRQSNECCHDLFELKDDKCGHCIVRQESWNL